MLYLALAYALVLAPFTPGFLTAENGRNLLLASLPLLLVALGETVVLITAGIDVGMRGSNAWQASNHAARRPEVNAVSLPMMAASATRTAIPTTRMRPVWRASGPDAAVRFTTRFPCRRMRR